MLHRLLLAASILTLAPAGVALAQGAPGACDDCTAEAPVIVVARPTELDNRLGVGLHMTSLAIANKANPDKPTQLGGGGVQVRYRLSPRWELELAIDALARHGSDGMPVGQQFHSGTLGARFHMQPFHRWDWYLLGAVGGIHQGEHHAGDAHQGRAQVQLGIGIERRWNHLSLGVDLRAVGIAPEKLNDQPVDQTGAAAKTTMPTPPPAMPSDRKGDTGAELSVAATYYF